MWREQDTRAWCPGLCISHAGESLVCQRVRARAVVETLMLWRWSMCMRGYIAALEHARVQPVARCDQRSAPAW